MNNESFNKITPTGTTSILTYNDIQTRDFNSIRIGTYCGKFINKYNNVFIGDKAGRNSLDVENSIFLGYNAGENLK